MHIKQFTKKLMCAVLAACITVPSLSGIAALAAESSMTENSVVVRIKTDYYIKNGKKVQYQKGGGYYPQFTGDDFRVSADVLRGMLGINYRYDSKTETANISANGKTFVIRAEEDGYTANGELKYIAKKENRMTLTKSGTNQFLPLIITAKSLGYNVYQKNSMYVITTLGKDKLTDSFYDGVYRLFTPENAIVNEDFVSPSGAWSYSTWSGGSAVTEESRDEPTALDSKAAYIGSTPKGFIGLLSAKKYDYNRAKSYRVTARVKTTSDFKDQEFSIDAWMYDSLGNFLGGRTFLNTDTKWSDSWRTYECILPEYQLRSTAYDNAASFNILLSCANRGSGAAGGVYVDSLVLEEYELPNEYVSTDLIADKYAAWYNTGDTVTYTAPNTAPLDNYSRINVRVYNSDNECVGTDTVSKDSFVTKGWSYTPAEPGYYEAEFDAVSQDGFSVPIATSYEANLGTDKNNNYIFNQFNTTRRSFAVVDGTAKPMEQRNDALLMSVSGDGKEEEFKLGDMLGLSGVRIHALHWGNGWGVYNGMENQEGVYTFGGADIPVNLANKYNFKTIMANVFGTPLWAVDEKYQDTSNVSYSYIYEKMAPRDMSYLDKFIKEFYKHYKGKIDILEFMNEPHYGNTAFWADTPEKLAEMIKTAYKSLREADPGGEMKMATASWNQGYQLFAEIMDDPEVYNSFDYFTFHSRDGFDLSKYKDSAAKKGYEFKPAYATEEYLYAEYTADKPKDHRMNTMAYVSKMLSHFKVGVNGFAQFELTDNVPDEVRYYCRVNGLGTSHVMGMFSPFPYLEPHKGAVAEFNLNKSMGLDFKYSKEYDLGDGTKGVLFENDGKPMMIVWNSKDIAFTLTDSLKAAVKDTSGLIDFEGRTFDKNDTLKPYTVYLLSDLDSSVLERIADEEGTALNADFETPYYTCEKPEYEEIEPTLPEDESKIVDNNPNKIFNEKTFKVSDDINWTTQNWNWVGNLDKPEGYSSKFAAHVDKDGLYLMVDTTDSVIYTPTDGGETFVDGMWQYDSVQFAVDCLGTGNADKRAEFQVAVFDGKPTLFKHVAPNIDFNMVSNWSRSASILDEKYVRIENTDHGQLYKIFVPMSELFPFQYSDSSEFMRFSVLVNNNDGNGRCYNEWTSGIGGSKDPKLFGAIRFK